MSESSLEVSDGAARLRRRLLGLTLLWTLANGLDLGWDYQQREARVAYQAEAALRAIFSNQAGFPSWATRHGGVQAPVAEPTAPDTAMPERAEPDPVAAMGRTLTPAKPPTIGVQSIGPDAEFGTVHGALVGLRPMNPRNAADAWERKALAVLAAGAEEVVEVERRGEAEPVLRMMYPVTLEEPCIECHGSQGFGVGDLVGGFSMSLPLASGYRRVDRELTQTTLVHLGLWLLGLGGLLWGGRRELRALAEREHDARALRASEERVRLVLASALDAVIGADADGYIREWLGQAETIFGWRPGEAVGRRLPELLSLGGDWQTECQQQGEVPDEPRCERRFEIRARHKDGHQIPLELTLTRVAVDGNVSFTVFARDLSRLKRDERRIARDHQAQSLVSSLLELTLTRQSLEQRLEQVLDLLLGASWLRLRPRAVRIAAGDGSGLPWLELLRGPWQADESASGEGAAERAWATGHPVFADQVRSAETVHARYCLPLRSEGLTLGILELILAPGVRPPPLEQSLLANVAHILAGSIRREQSEQDLHRHAFHDELTGLPNRALFVERLDRAIKRCSRHPEYFFALLFLDLDRFKTVNDSLGHAAGDRLLAGVARRLWRCVRPSDTVARLGGDEFTLLLEDLADDQDALRVAARVHRELAQPFHLGRQEIFTATSIGIAYGGPDYQDAGSMLRDADTAMYRAKSRGSGQVEVFERTMHAQAMVSLQLERELRRALIRGEMRAFLQPLVAVGDGRVAGFEALVRWQHPQRGLLLPASFLPMAEETGLIGTLGLRVLRMACRRLGELGPVSGDAGPNLSINLSVRQLGLPGFIQGVEQVLSETGFDPQRLILEIPEAALIDNPESLLTPLQPLRERGVRLLLDDFGSRYASVGYLHRLPVDGVKVGRDLVARVHAGKEYEQVIAAILSVAHSLDRKVVAQGVEDAEQFQHLQRLGCDLIQGFYLSEPLDHEGLSDLRLWARHCVSSRPHLQSQAIAPAMAPGDG